MAGQPTPPPKVLPPEIRPYYGLIDHWFPLIRPLFLGGYVRGASFDMPGHFKDDESCRPQSGTYCRQIFSEPHPFHRGVVGVKDWQSWLRCKLVIYITCYYVYVGLVLTPFLGVKKTSEDNDRHS